ncbi:MAG: hypothetical protein GTO51_03430 [Candidatus Latescibacteria bacterium]|nr:hypothetical protein [Candidatus Latescibacterota bacterium]NIM20890.1 hypothetical protein [Candidatus Latescibacterota bacterium]NIM65025.1 hypothetical protein [Candidatus Latescibacterota bacterium]NIO01540.1 hypothetical protein [Candidatus Latescibacterota bacterium]NIO28057.1 hypothetical protein [Candidatus Latescibacterota bacterium]
MSKIFDALRRAEEERRKRAAASRETTAVPERRETRIRPVRGEFDGFPEDFFRQLGILRNSIDSSLEGKPKKSLLFTSATPSEGTTTVSTSFARMLALQGEGRVLLCEMNASSPSFRQIFSLSNEAGITDYFSGGRSLASIAHSTTDGNLDVVHVGKQDPAIIQIHLKRVFPALVKEALGVYDAVIFDAPSVVSSPETPRMSAYVDGVVLIVHAGRTKREVVQRSMDAIVRFDGNVIGVVLNRKKYYIPDFLYKRI